METKQIIDPNYVLDEKGKAHYLFDKKNSNGQVEKTFRTHSKHGGGGNTSASESSPRPRSTRAKAAPAVNDKKSKKRKRRGNRWDSDDDESDDFEDYNDNSGTFTMSNWGTTKRTRTRASTRATADVGSEGSGEMDQDEDEYDSDAPDASNPLPGFVDPITLDEVVKPAISKYGHVMGYVPFQGKNSDQKAYGRRILMISTLLRSVDMIAGCDALLTGRASEIFAL